MNIYIPQHLRKMKIMEDLCSMILEYSSKYESATGSFDDYQIYLKIDPVRRFIGLCLDEMYRDRLETGDMKREEYENILDYLTKIFYTIKGTYNVLVYMQRYLGIEFINVLYTARVLSFTLARIIGNDVSIFDEYLKAFLYNLLYVERLEYGVQSLRQNIKENLEFYGSLGMITYKRFIPKIEYEI